MDIEKYTTHLVLQGGPDIRARISAPEMRARNAERYGGWRIFTVPGYLALIPGPLCISLFYPGNGKNILHT